jgi:hypothetical protein
MVHFSGDLIDKYVRIAKNCLVGDTKLHQRTEMKSCSSQISDFMLATALKLEANTANRKFSSGAWGLHFGKV